jgi:hypothetical protein
MSIACYGDKLFTVLQELFAHEVVQRVASKVHHPVIAS